MKYKYTNGFNGILLIFIAVLIILIIPLVLIYTITCNSCHDKMTHITENIISISDVRVDDQVKYTGRDHYHIITVNFFDDDRRTYENVVIRKRFFTGIDNSILNGKKINVIRNTYKDSSNRDEYDYPDILTSLSRSWNFKNSQPN